MLVMVVSCATLLVIIDGHMCRLLLYVGALSPPASINYTHVEGGHWDPALGRPSVPVLMGNYTCGEMCLVRLQLPTKTSIWMNPFPVVVHSDHGGLQPGITAEVHTLLSAVSCDITAHSLSEVAIRLIRRGSIAVGIQVFPACNVGPGHSATHGTLRLQDCSCRAFLVHNVGSTNSVLHDCYQCYVILIRFVLINTVLLGFY